MKLYTPDATELMTIHSIEPLSGSLQLRGEIFGTMPVTAIVRPSQARAALRLLGVRSFVALVWMLVRKDPK